MMRLASIAAVEYPLPSKCLPRALICRRAALGAAVGAFAVAIAADATAQGWKPEKAVEYVVGSAPGGGNDKTARTMLKIWQGDKWLDNATVVNKVGGGGAVAYSYVAQRAADPHFVAVVRKALLSNHILGRSTLNYTEMTPLAVVGEESMALAVRADSPIKSVKELAERI